MLEGKTDFSGNEAEVQAQLGAITATSRELIEWYWSHGCRRKGAYRLNGDWLRVAYECAAKADAIRDIAQLNAKPNLAVWGPSQTGKSTLLATLIDNSEKSDSAMNWGNAGRFIFSTPSGAQRRLAEENNVAIPEIFNPFNVGKDGSAVVGRYYVTDGTNLPDESNPIGFEMGTTRDLLFALAVGYLGACDTKFEDDSEKIWDVDGLAALLSNYYGDSEVQPGRSQVELTLSFVSVIDDLILGEHYKRYTNLQQSNAWDSRLRSEILANQILTSESDTIFEFISTVLWDNSPLVDQLFSDLLDMKSRIESLCDGDRLFLSVDLAQKLVNMNLHSDLLDPSSNKGNSVSEKNLTISKKDGYSVLESDGSGETIVSTGEQFAYKLGLLQACCWELSIPLRRDFFQDGDPRRNLLEGLSILDVPGITNEGEATRDEKLKVHDKPTDERVFSRLLKRGKTFSIVGKYARDLKIDGVLLLVRSANPLPQPSLISEGIRSILHSIDPNYSLGRREDLPIPVTLNFTFFSKVVAGAFANGKDYDFKLIDEHLSPVGAIASPENAYAFVTNYPQLPEGALAQDISNSEEYVRNTIIGQHASIWTSTRFKTEPELQSLEHFWDEDGGITHLLSAQRELLSNTKRRQRIENHVRDVSEKIYQIVVEAGPEFEEDGQRAQQAISDLRSSVVAETEAFGAMSEDERSVRTEELSKHLRAVFSCFPSDFEALASAASRVRKPGLQVFLVEILSLWTNSNRRRDALKNLGVKSRDVPLVLEALTGIVLRDLEEFEEWCRTWFDPTEDQSEEHQMNAMRFLAANISNKLKQSIPKGVGATSQDLRARCEDKFDVWQRSPSKVNLELVIEPALDLLDSLPSEFTSAAREYQEGDDELMELWRTSGLAVAPVEEEQNLMENSVDIDNG